jgi:hypothetical protein
MKPSRHLTSSSQLALWTLLGFISFSFGQAGTSDKAQLARLMWSAFQCGTYARLSDDENEQTRLFLVGLKAGREAIRATNGRGVMR